MNKTSNPGVVAFIGCGNIAHVHMRFLQRAGYKVDAVCDSSHVRCKLFAEQYGIERTFTGIDELLAEAKPRIVHILTPPHTHHHLISSALKAGSNVLVEKPLCQTAAEYSEIASLAKESGLLVTVDHTRVFNPMIIKARGKIQKGDFGKIIKMDYQYDDPSITKSKNDKQYSWAKGSPAWFAQLRGGVLTDLLPHPLAVFLSFVEDLKIKHIQARTLSGGIIEELSVMMQSDDVDAQLSLSINQRPLKNTFTIYCEKGSIQIDLRGMYSVYQPDRRLPGIVSRAVVAISTAWQITTGFSVNVVKLLTGKAHTYDGLGEIITKFYDQISNNETAEVPMVNKEQVMNLADEILSSALKNNDPAKEKEIKTNPTTALPADCLVLGGTGFIGQRVVKALIDVNKRVRVICRQTSNIRNLPKQTDTFYGDLRSQESLIPALSATKTVIHCAAAMNGDWADFYESTVQGTKNVLAAIEEASQVEKLIYISSLGVLDYNKLSNGDKVDESSPIEARPADRGFYTRAKVEAEQLVKEFAERNKHITTIILRPGLVYGQESNNNIQNCGIQLDKFLFVFGLGRRSLGLNYVENLAQAVVLAHDAALESGAIIQIVDAEQPTVRKIIKKYNKLSDHKIIPIYIPVALWKTLFLGVDTLLYIKNKKFGTFRYRFASNSKILHYCPDYAFRILGNYCRYSLTESFQRSYRKILKH